MEHIFGYVSRPEVVAISGLGSLALLITILKLVFCGKGFRLKFKDIELEVPSPTSSDPTDRLPPYGLIFLLIIVELFIYAISLIALVRVVPG